MSAQTQDKVIISSQVRRETRDELALRAAAQARMLSAEIRAALTEHLEREHIDEKGER